MPIIRSPFPDLDLPRSNILTHLFPPADTPPPTTPLYIDADDPSHHSLSAAEVLIWVRRLGLGLERVTEAGDVVMMLTPNHILVPVTYLGIVGNGRVFSAANPVYTVQEVAHQLRDTSAKLFLVHPSLLDTAIKASREANLPTDCIYQFSDHQAGSSSSASSSSIIPDFRTLLADSTSASTWTWPPLPDDESVATVATINYSSGTTGLPKGVCITHSNLIANVEQVIHIRYTFRPWPTDTRPEERWAGLLPLHHAYGQLFYNLIALRLNVPLYVMRAFAYERFLRLVQDHRITALQIAPPVMVMLDKRPETHRYDLSSLRDVMCGAAPLSQELQEAVSKKFGCVVVQGWGMTETVAGAIHVPGGVVDETGSVGMLDPNIEARLADDEGKEVSDGEPGELCIRGPNIFTRYWRNDRATMESFDKEGFFKTGDVAIMRRGWFWIVDRKKELIKVNAFQVAPAELEAVLLENDDVADSAVVGVTLHGEEYPRAYVALKDHARVRRVSETEIQEWIKPRVAKHKDLVGGVAFVDEVPKSPSGKILRKIVREWAKRDAPGLEERVVIPRSRARL